MPGQTKLYQRAGSPLIMGHSRYERSAWVDWTLAALVSSAVVIAGLAVVTLMDPTRPYLGSPEDIAVWLLRAAPGLLVAVSVSGIVVWFGHRAGWRKAWLGAALIGALFGIVGMVLGWRVL